MAMGQIWMMPKTPPIWGQKEHWQALLDSATEGICGLDPDGRSMLVNRAAADMLGFSPEEMLGAVLHDLVHRHGPGQVEEIAGCQVHSIFLGKQPAGHWAGALVRKDGMELAVEISSEPVVVDGVQQGVAVTLREAGSMFAEERALWKLEKLASIGQLASSIAHEINNPLESITNLLYLIQHANEMDEVRQYAGLAQDELQRVTEITLQTLRFHRQHTRPVEVDMTELLSSVMALYTGRLLVRDVAIDLKLKAAPKIVCLEGEVRQVINNLVRNALDAMPGGGMLYVRLHGQRDADTGARGVRLTVADTGEGISNVIMPRLFQPFQTTKEMTGTGLGLWVSKGIVEKHGGSIRFRTRRGTSRHGTAFTVWLPVEPSVSLSPEAD